MSDLQNIELFQRYHSGELSAVERAVFDSRLLSDDVFKEQFDGYNETEKLIRLRELFSVKEELDKYDYADGDSWWTTRNLIFLIGLLGGMAALLFTVRHLGSDKKETTSMVMPISEPSPRPIVKTSTHESTKKEASKSLKPIKDSVYFIEMPVVASPEFITEESSSNEKTNLSNKEEKQPCPLLVPTLSITPSCFQKASGYIRVDEIKGGVAPYSIRINNGKLSKKFPFTSENLSADSYYLVIVDKAGCIFEKNIDVPEIECKELSEINTPKNLDYRVTLPYESWDIPDCPSQGTLEIIDQAGVLVYSGTLNAAVSTVWNCENTNGVQVKPGVYFYKISDLETREERSGSITILK